MSMVLRTNMNSMNANRNLSINNSQVAKAIEKLASGYQINRAADDASGLAISEKMAAQITGLDQGTENALDGIGLVQTAEGAMEEIHNMLNRIVELSTKSANGTIQDEVDREAIQAEVDVLVDEIDRIAQATNFNGIQLLDGSLSDGGLVIRTNTTMGEVTEILAETTIKDLNIDELVISYAGDFIITGGEQGVDFDYDNVTGELTILSSTDMRIEIKGGSDVENIVIADNIGNVNLALNGVNITSTVGSAFSTGINNNVYIELEGDNVLSSTYGDGTDTSTYYGSAGLNVGEGTNITIGGTGSLEASSKYGAGIGSDYGGTSGNITIVSGFITATGGVRGAGIGSGSLGSVGDITITGGTINATGGFGATGIGSGCGILWVTGVQPDDSFTEIIGIQSYATAGNITILGGDITAIGGDHAAGIGAGRAGSTGYIKYVESIVNATCGGDLINIYPDDIGNGVWGTTGTITKVQLPTINFETEDNTNSEYETTYTTTTNTALITKTEVYNGDGLILHVADQNNPYNKIEVFIDSMRAEALDIDPLDVSSQESAGAAINIVKDAINYVSKNRGDLGALQNRLERTINNNNNTSENMSAARSAIKDTDMAAQMLEYTKMDVLTQASQSMLAQSNQAPQQVLSLLG